MSRLPHLSREDLAEDDQRLLERPINLFRVLAHSPEVLRWMHGMGGWIRYRSELDPRLRELAIIQVGYLARSEYEFSHHVQIGSDFGVTEEDLRGLIAETAGERSDLGEPERLVLATARALTEGTVLSDELWTGLGRYFEPARVVDLVFVITHYAQVVRMLGALQVDVEPEWEPYLEHFTPASGTPTG